MRKIDVFKKEVIIMLFLFFSVHFAALAQTVTLTGTVKDNTGDPLPGVNIVVVGTTQGTVSDLDGKFTLEAPVNGALTFNFIGFKAQTLNIGGQRVFNVTLFPSDVSLDEVVVVGYGVQRKSDVTGSITSVNVERLRDVPASNITKALQGKTAGVEIQNTSTRPGGGTMIRIRGNRSLTASNDPLIVVDGIPFGGSLNDIAMDDIASIEILKDASAAVIYGSRGSNGVVLIQTKRGKKGDVKVTYNGYFGVTTVARSYDVYNAEEFIKLRTVANYTDYLLKERESMLVGRETDWQNLIYQDGVTSNHEVNISGGTDTNQYSFSGGYFNETGVLPDIGFERFTMRTAIDQKLGEYVKIGFSSMNNFAITDGQSANPMWSAISLSPLAAAYNTDGTLIEQPAFPTDETYNPLTLRDHSRWEEQNRRVSSFNTFYGEVEFMKGVKYRLNVGVDFSQNKYNNFFGSKTPFRSGALNQAQVQNNDNLAYTVENLLLIEKTLNDVHRFNFTGMYSVQESTFTSSRMDGENSPVNYIKYNNFSLFETITAPTNNNNYSRWGLVSYMARLNYAFKDKYLVTLTGRIDGSSRLAPGNKWHQYPALSLGWNIINESFMQNQNVVSNLKLRAGLGQTSNTSINPYSTLGGLTGTFYNFGSTGVKGYYVSTLPNDDLSWEYTTSYNLGLDYGLLDGRLSGSVDVYLQETNELLLGQRLPSSQGVPGQFLRNIGETENKGFEAVLNASIIRPRKDGDFGLDLSLNAFFNKEKIVALQDKNTTQDIGNGWFVGYPTSSIYDYVKIGIWQLGEEVEAAGFGAKPGDIKLADLDKSGTITDADRKILGASQPDLQGGFTLSMEYKGFDFSTVGYFRMGGLIISTLHQPNAYINRLDGRRNGIKVDYWSETNPTNDMPKPHSAINTNRSSVLGYFDGSFLKVRSINLGYNIPNRFASFMGSDAKIRVYSSVTDPFILFSPYIDKGGVDPEPNGQGGGNQANDAVPNRAWTVGLNAPPTTKFIFGLNVKF